MKHSLKVFLLLAVVVLSACNQKRPAQRFNSREVPRGIGADLGGVDPSQKLCGDNCAWGKFYEDYGSGFENNVKRFASVSVPIGEIGSIDSSLSGSQTGVWFWGEIGIQGGNLATFLQSGQQSLSVGPNSRLAVVIYDSLSVQNASGLKPIVSYFAGNRDGYTVTGTVSRQGTVLVADLRFADQWGMIRLNGTIAGQTLQTAQFTGQVSFQNACSMTSDGSCSGQSEAPSEMALGKFAVEACRFFSCQ